MTAWLAVGIVVGIACGVVLVAIARLSREMTPTRRALGDFRAGLEPVLVRVQTETDTARRRLAGREPQG